MAALRKIVLRVLLVALGLSALAGAAAVLTSGRDVAWRIVGTTLATAGAAVLLIPMTLLGDRPTTRNAGVLGIAIVVVEFLLAMILIWGLADGALGAFRGEEAVFLTMVWIAITGLPAVSFLSVASRPGGKVAGFGGAVLAAITLVLLMLATLTSSSFLGDEKLYAIAAAVGGFGVLAVASLAGFTTAAPTARPWRWVGVLASVLGIAIAAYASIKDIHEGGGLFACVISIAAVVAHANLCATCPLTRGQRWVRSVTIGAGIVTALLIDVLVIGEDRWDAVEQLANVAGATGIIAGCGSLALLVLARLNRNIDRPPVISEISELTLICPSCHRKQLVALARDATSAPTSACGNCGLQFHIRVEEPRCPKCDYVLLMLRSDRCPECGTLVSAPTTLTADAGV